MNAKDVHFFEKVKSQLEQLHGEASLLSKSKPDNPMNKFKLALINEKLGEANKILTGEFQPFKDFTVFNLDELPTNSDVVMVLSQYLDGLEAWRCAHIWETAGMAYKWKTDDGQDIRSQPPSRFVKSNS
jgi:hypothetical protein